jgi:anti-sigma regulatory factor (Ser/Thr protein kinase)
VLQVPSRTEFLATVRDVTRRMAELSGFERGVAEQLALAVDEAAANVIEHAYAGSPDRVIELRYADGGESLRIEVVDHGRAVDPSNVPQVDLARYASERRTGGLGVHLMGRIMDSVSFQRSADENRCCLSKRKPSPSGAPQP